MRAGLSGYTVKALLEDAVQRLTGAGIESPRRNAEWLLSEILSTGRAGIYGDLSATVDDERAVRFKGMLQRRLAHEPLQYILGFTEFFGLRLVVTPDVLIPRPETEELVESALQCLQGSTAPRVLDVGTGSGCIALAVKAARPDATVYACDVSAAALEVARRNAAEHELAVTFLEVDALGEDFAASVPDQFNLLVSNPPYVTEDEAAELPADVRSYEPHLALFARNDPVVFYRALARQGSQLIEPSGWIALETHVDHGREVMRILDETGYRTPELKKDLAGRDRIVMARR